MCVLGHPDTNTLEYGRSAAVPNANIELMATEIAEAYASKMFSVVAVLIHNEIVCFLLI